MTGARPRTVYTVTRKGEAALAAWLGELPAPPSLEFEGMLKVFFADGGTIDQLRTTLTSIAETADERVALLQVKVDEIVSGEAPFPERAHLNAIGLRFHIDHERAIATWAKWALDQTSAWRSTTEPGGWDLAKALA